MNKKALVLAVGLAFATPAICVAKALPSNLVGMNLGEIQSNSYLNEPYKGIIPILFANIETSKKLNIRLAPESIFNKIGAEKLSILESLKFSIISENNKPVISITSTQPIQMPFLNFVLEIEGPNGSIYQDYTTLLDPKKKTGDSFSQAINPQISTTLSNSVASSSTILNSNRTLKVKSGDTLSQIAQALNAADISLKKMVNAIHTRNPNAFVNNNINRLKTGAVLHIPTKNELKNSNFKIAAKIALKNKPSNFDKSQNKNTTYTIKRGDNLSTITKKFGHNGVSFTKMMAAIHTANPHAFSNNRINLLKIGKILTIPSLEKVTYSNKSISKTDPNLITLDDSNKSINSKLIDLNIENNKEFVLDGFIIEKGDTLAKITKQIGHKDVPYSKMMQAIYIANPDAFEKNNITTLTEGAVIRLPAISEIEELIHPAEQCSGNSCSTDKFIENQPLDPIETKDSSINETPKSLDNSAVINKLEKRIRELKRDLNKAHTSLSDLEQSLSEEEPLLKQQSNNLSELATTLEELNSTSISTNSENKPQEAVPEGGIVENSKIDYSPFSVDSSNIMSTTKALLPPELIKSDIEATKSGYAMPTELNQKISQNIKSKLLEYSQYMSGKELFATILALLFGLLLVRYRREIYAYTSISYDYPKYYPPFGEEEAKTLLKEKQINFQDTLIDPPTDIHEENKPEFSNELLQECEDLADELTGSLDIKTSVHSDNSSWDELDKTCDVYIEEYKEKNVVEMLDVSDNIINGAKSAPEEMTFELFEALAEGVTENNSNPIPKKIQNDTLIYGVENSLNTTDDIFEEAQPIPFSELAALSEKLENNKKLVN